MKGDASSSNVGTSCNVPDEDKDEMFFDDQWDDNAEGVFETMDDNTCRIQPGLLISGFLAEQNKEKLQQAGVTHIVQVAEGLSPSHPDDFVYLSVPALDASSEDLCRHFPAVFDFITQALNRKGNVLVHCIAGVSRSAAICIGYLMWQHRICYDEAFKLVHAARPWVMPNTGFRAQLLRFEELSCDLARLSQIDTIVSELPSSAESGGAADARTDDSRATMSELDLVLPQRSARSEVKQSNFMLATIGGIPSHQGSKRSRTYVPELGTSF